MRAIQLAIAFVLLLVWVAPARAQQAAASSALSFQSDMAYRPSADVFRPAAQTDSTRRLSVRPDDSGLFDKNRDPLSQPSANTCYMIRSYVFVRERGESDATRLAGQTTCTPSAKFQMKSAARLVHADSR